jgi:hypothetical protein
MKTNGCAVAVYELRRWPVTGNYAKASYWNHRRFTDSPVHTYFKTYELESVLSWSLNS